MRGWQRSLGASQAPFPHHRLTGEARTLKHLSAPGGIPHPHTQTSVACCPCKVPLTFCCLALFCSLPPQWGTPLPATQIIQRTLNQEPWVFSLCCVPGSSAPYSGLRSARVGFLALRGALTTPSLPHGPASFPLPLLQASFPGVLGPLEVGTPIIFVGQMTRQAQRSSVSSPRSPS